MVEPRHRRPAAPAGSAPTTGQSAGGGAWLVIGIIIVSCFAIGRCSSPTTNSSDNVAMADMNVAQEALGSAIATQTLATVEPLSKTSVRRGEAHLRFASAEGLAGEMIYSQNCYDALSRHFTWAKLDVCGAFDIEAVQSLGDSETMGLDKEAAWFESESAAGRYLKAATSAGEDADKADTRLSDLQARVARSRPHVLPGPDATPFDGNVDAPAQLPVDNASGTLPG